MAKASVEKNFRTGKGAMGNCLARCWNLREETKGVFRTNSIHPNGEKDERRKRDTVLENPGRNLLQEYQMGRVLGKGQSCETRECMEKSTGKKYACKSISKSKLDGSYIRQEVEVLEKLSGHPNIVELKGAYENEKCVHLVMELCAGGDLFHDFVRRKTYSEPDAAHVCRAVMDVVCFCQTRGVIHRDIKLENILLASSSSSSLSSASSSSSSLSSSSSSASSSSSSSSWWHQLNISSSLVKVADFGLALPFHPGTTTTFSDLAGSAYYIAPEVLQQRYGPEIDVWSAGVLLYIMLSGRAPFWDVTEEGIFEAIMHGFVDLDRDPWPKRSKAVKNLIRGMLCKNVEHRLTPQQVLNHEWVLMHTQSSDLSFSSSSEKEALLSNCWSDNSPKSSSSEAFSN